MNNKNSSIVEDTRKYATAKMSNSLTTRTGLNSNGTGQFQPHSYEQTIMNHNETKSTAESTSKYAAAKMLNQQTSSLTSDCSFKNGKETLSNQTQINKMNCDKTKRIAESTRKYAAAKMLKNKLPTLDCSFGNGNDETSTQTQNNNMISNKTQSTAEGTSKYAAAKIPTKTNSRRTRTEIRKLRPQTVTQTVEDRNIKQSLPSVAEPYAVDPRVMPKAHFRRNRQKNRTHSPVSKPTMTLRDWVSWECAIAKEEDKAREEETQRLEYEAFLEYHAELALEKGVCWFCENKRPGPVIKGCCDGKKNKNTKKALKIKKQCIESDKQEIAALSSNLEKLKLREIPEGQFDEEDEKVEETHPDSHTTLECDDMYCTDCTDPEIAVVEARESMIEAGCWSEDYENEPQMHATDCSDMFCYGCYEEFPKLKHQDDCEDAYCLGCDGESNLTGGVARQLRQLAWETRTNDKLEREAEERKAKPLYACLVNECSEQTTEYYCVLHKATHSGNHNVGKKKRVVAEAHALFDFNFMVNHRHTVEVPAVERFFAFLNKTRGSHGLCPIDWISVVKEFGFMCAHISQNYSLKGIVTSFAHFISNLPISNLVAVKLHNLITKLAERPRAHSGVSESLAVAVLSSLGAVLVVLGIGKLPTDKSITDFISRLSRMDGVIRSLGSIRKVVQTCLEQLIDFVRVNFFGYESSTIDAWREMNQWCDKILELHTTGFSKLLLSDAELKPKLDLLNVEGQQHLKTLDAIKANQNERGRFNACYLRLQSMIVEANGVDAGACVARVPPVIVHFFGETSIGKSEMLNMLNAYVLAKLGYDDVSALDKLVYYRDESSDYFDGCTNEVVITVVDDFGMNRDSEARPSKVGQEAIRMGNSAPWQLPMAHLANKGNTYFNSKLVLWTSNKATVNFPSMTYPSAVRRRVDKKIRMRPHPDFAKVVEIERKRRTILDVEKVQAKLVEVRNRGGSDAEVYLQVWLFDVVDPLRETALREPLVVQSDLSFEEIAASVVNLINVKQERGGQRLNFSRDYFRTLRGTPEAHAGEMPEYVEGENEIDGLGPMGEEYPWYLRWQRYFSPPEAHYSHSELLAIGAEQEWARVARPCDWYSLLKKYPCFVIPNATLAKRIAHAYVTATLAAERVRGIDQIGEFNHAFSSVVDGRRMPLEGCQKCKNRDSRSWLERIAAFNEYRQEEYPIWANAAFEIACLALIIAASTTLLETVRNFIYMLFPCLDQERNAKMTKLRDLEKTLGTLKQGTAIYDLVLLRVNTVRSDLGMKTMAFEVTEEIDIEGAELEHMRALCLKSTPRGICIRPHVCKVCKRCEKHDDCTDSESNEERSKGNTRVKVESNEERTRGNARVRVESNEERTKGNTRVKTECDGTELVTVGTPECEAVTDVNAKQIEAAVIGNQYAIMSGDSQIGTVTMMKGRIGVTNKHIVEILQTLPRFVIRRGMIEIEMEYSQLRVACASGLYANRDIALIEFPRAVPLGRDISKHLMTKYDFSTFKTLASLGMVRRDGNTGGPCVYYTQSVRAEDRCEMNMITGFGNMVVRDYFTYSLQSVKGYCGGLLVAYDKSFNRKIIGVHMAGLADGREAYGAALHAELFETLLKELEPEAHAESILDAGSEFQRDEDEEEFFDAFDNLGTVEISCSTSGETAIRPSLLHDMFTPTSMPAKLKPFRVDGEIKNPLLLARAKAATRNIVPERDLLEECVAHYKETLFMGKRCSDDRVLTWEECIAGVEGDECYSPIKRNSSPGFGWDKGGKAGLCGKQKWLGSEEYVFDNPELLEARDRMLEKLKQGKRSGAVWTDTLKDERRPIAKVLAGKTRLFAAGEMVYTLLFRKYFMGFCAHVMRNKISVESCVGINVYSQDWCKIARVMRRQGPHVVAGDFSNYDGTLNGAVLWYVLDLIEDFYESATEEDRLVRRMMWMDIVYSIHATPEGKVTRLYSWTHSQPSGCPATVIINSVYHSIVARYVYRLCARRANPRFDNFVRWDKYVEHLNYGDDDLYNINPEIISWFNQETMAEFFLELGMVYTDEAKTGEVVRSRTLDDVAFLKRKFRFDEKSATYFAPLDLGVVKEMALWVKSDKNVPELTKETLEDAIMELEQHPEDVFEEIIPVFRKGAEKLREYGFRIHVPTYKESRRNALMTRLSDAHTQETNNKMNIYRTQSTAESTSKYAAAKMLIEAHSGLQPTTETNIEEEVHEIVTFADEGTVEHIDNTLPVKQSVRESEDILKQGLINFLQRPVKLDDFVWESSKTALTPLFSFELPTHWITKKMIADKITGFRYLRCNLHIRVQVNAQPANAGYLLLVFEPVKKQLTASPSSSNSLQGLTGYPCAKLDIANGTAVELAIPFFSTITHFDLIHGSGTMGTVSAYVYSPLTGSANVDGSVFAWGSDIDLDTVTGAKIQRIVAHAGDIRSGVPLKKPTENCEPGIIEKTAGVVRSVANAVSHIPVMGDIAQVVEWGARATESVASWFGWSKPLDTEHGKRVLIQFQENSANSDGVSQGKSLALLSNNAITIPTDLFGTEEDEMTFAHIMSRPTFIDSFTIQEGELQGTTLWGWPVDPMSCKKETYENAAVAPYMPRNVVCLNNFVSYCASACRYWKGSLKYHFHFVKSPLHSARVRVSFIPGCESVADVSDVDFDMCQSVIYDLRESSDFVYEVPYKWNTAWKAMDAVLSRSDSLTPNRPTGLVVVTLVNALRRPTIADPKIECVVEVSAGEDLAFAVPRIQQSILYTTDAAVKATFPAQKPSERPVIEAHSVEADTIGEVVTGFRQLLKRFEPLKNPITGDEVQPYASLYRDPIVTTDPTTYYDMASSIFRFLSGSVNVIYNGKSDFCTISLCPPTDSQEVGGARATVFKTPEEPSVEVRVPFYQPQRGILTDLGLPAEGDDTSFQKLPYNAGSRLIISPFTETAKLWRNIGEDFSFGYLLGPPRTIVPFGPTVCPINWAPVLRGKDIKDKMNALLKPLAGKFVTLDMVKGPTLAAQQVVTDYMRLHPGALNDALLRMRRGLIGRSPSEIFIERSIDDYIEEVILIFGKICPSA